MDRNIWRSWTKRPFYYYLTQPGQFFKRIKWCWQRITRGYCDCDLWDLDCYVSELIESMLYDFADKTQGYPDTLCKDIMEWRNKIMETAYAFTKFNVNYHSALYGFLDEDPEPYRKAAYEKLIAIMPHLWY